MSISSYFNRRLRSVVLHLVNVLKQRSLLTFSATLNCCSEGPLKMSQMLSMPSIACTATIINLYCTLSSRYILLRRTGPGYLAWFERYPSGFSTHSSPRWNHEMNEPHTTSTGGCKALHTLPNFVEGYGNVWFINISARSQRQLNFTYIHLSTTLNLLSSSSLPTFHMKSSEPPRLLGGYWPRQSRTTNPAT
jgi:hypothetical protein